MNNEDKLQKMGAAWFVSYCYYNKVDHEHKNWQKVPTSLQMRLSFYNSSKEHHSSWLKQVLNMNESRLDKNEIGLSGEEVKAMAFIILKKLN